MSDQSDSQGIDLTRLSAGLTLYVETTEHLYEMTLLDAERSELRIVGTDPRFHKPTNVLFIKSICGRDAKVTKDQWIGKALRMVLKKGDTLLYTSSVLSASVSGDGWSYEVFA